MDIIVANAAFVEVVPTALVTPEHFDKTFNINARGTFFTVQKGLRLLRNGGSIVLVSSGAHLKGIPFYVTYSATKAAMRSFARSWAADLKDRGIRVNTLSPGPIDTPIIDGQFKTKQEADAAKTQFAQMTPLGRLGRSEEMAAAILFLASNDSIKTLFFTTSPRASAMTSRIASLISMLGPDVPNTRPRICSRGFRLGVDMSLKSAVLRPLSVYTRIGNAEFQRSRKISPGSSSSRYTMSVIPENTRHLYIGSLIFPKLDQMDFPGPFEIFSSIPNSTYHIIAKETKPLRDTRGPILVPEKTFSEVPTLGLLHIPGGYGQKGLMDDEETLSFVREQAVEACCVFAVCTSALVLGSAGLLKGRKVTTHWAAFDLLIYFGGVPVNRRVVIDRNLVTTSGVSAGIDGALRVAALLRGSQTAQEIQLGIQYAPEPPFNSGTPESAPPEVLAAVRSRLEKVSDARLATARRTGARLGIAEPGS